MKERICPIRNFWKGFRNPSRESFETIEFLQVSANLFFGGRKAALDFMADKPEPVLDLSTGQGLIIKSSCA